MRFFSAAEIDGLLTFPALVDALGAAFRGDIVTPVRHHHEVARPDATGTLLLMPAWTGPEISPAYLGTKVATVYPGNASKGLPSVMGTYLLMDGATGKPLAALDGTRLTLWRTAAASALASRMLERPDSKRMLMVGAGALSPFLVKAHRSVRNFEDVAIWARRPEAAAEVVAELAADGIAARVAEDLEAEARQADLISCATLSREPIVQGRWLKRTAHLDLVGAFNMAMREADDEALQRAHVFVDTEAAARYLALEGHTLECYRSLGGGPVFHKFGKWVRYAVDDLDVWAESCRRLTTASPAAPRILPIDRT